MHKCIAVKTISFSVFVEQHKIGGYVEKQCVLMMDPGGLKYWTCGICNKALNHKQDLLRHEATHTGQNPFPCQNCDRSFNKKAALRSQLFMQAFMRY